MKPKKTEEQVVEGKIEEKAIVIQEPQDLAKPERDTKFAHESAKILVDIVRKNGWARRLGGQSEHLQYEAWQTVGKYYGYIVRTGEANPVEVGGVTGFKATAKVVNEVTGIEVGGAEAYCMKDEYNWKTKPLFQLASMAQTRAGSKALRQILGFVVALAGYSPTPAEEMEGIHNSPAPRPLSREQVREVHQQPLGVKNGTTQSFATEYHNGKSTSDQIDVIAKLLIQKGYTREQLMEKYDVTNLLQLTYDQADTIITNLKKLEDKVVTEVTPAEAEQGIEELKKGK